MQEYQCLECPEAKLVLNKGAVLLDIRDQNSFYTAHDKQAQNLHNDNLQKILTPLSPDQPILILCYHGISSKNAAQFISSQGFNQVISINGGFEAWSKLHPQDIEHN